ncbi:LysR substrate-binding domain-containing protein [Rubripirellula amarantea]|nr:LysR substrate-binding domain-containing protein [Rubripirellula amarantea]
MELRHLRYFVAVATELNFSKAAESQLVAQPALSTQIADLEREVGTSLLFRNKRVVRLTAAGAVFLEEARSILSSADAAKTKALRASRGEVGELAIGFFAAPMMHTLPDLIRRYRADYPDVTIRMHELTPDCQLSAFANKQIDIGFTRPLPAGHPELMSKTLLRERWVAVVPETHRLASRRRIKLSQLAQDPFVLLDRPVASGLYDQIIAACRAANFSPAVAHSPDLMATVLTLVAAEQGVSIVPEGVQNLLRKQVSFLPISPALERIPLVMCWRKDCDSPPAEAFRNLVEKRKASLSPQS